MSEHELLTCQTVLEELQRVLTTKFKLPPSAAIAFCDLLEMEAELVAAPSIPALKLKDPSDAPIVACAIAAKADVFVTGDKALLDLHEIDNLPVLSPRDLWKKVRG